MTKVPVYTAKLAGVSGTGTLPFDLAEVLAPLSPWGQALQWKLLWLRGTGPDIVSLEHRVLENDRGLKLSWGELLQLARRIQQVEDAVLVASTESLDDVTWQSWEEQKHRFDISIEAVDSSYWLVSVLDRAACDALRGVFKDGFNDLGSSRI
jgi:hypothetical protein